MAIPEPKLAESSHRLLGQPMFKLLSRARELERKGKKIIHFEIGEPDFKTPQDIIAGCQKSLDRGETHYVPSQGLWDLIEAVRNRTKKDLGFKPKPGQILISPANAVIYFLIRCAVNQSEEVIIPDPGFATYHSALNFAGLKSAAVPLLEKNNFRMNPSDIKKIINSKTKLLIINSPSNPTGSVMTKKEIEEVASLARKHNLFLLSDETYSQLVYNGKFFSPAAADKCLKRTIILNSFSKTYAMTGWRLGYAIGPEELIEKMTLLLQTIISCLPEFIQRGGVRALTASQKPVRRMLAEYKRRRDLIVKGLNSLPGVSSILPDGAFYVFPNIAKTGLTSEEFSELMLEKAGVALLPGTNFGQYGQGYVRLCYANSRKNIEEAIKRMRQVLKKEV